MTTPSRIRDILDFWFMPAGHPEHGRLRKIWFMKDATFDAEIRARFLGDHELAAAGGCDAWAETPEGALALLILLDQVPRNLFRGEPRAFASDAKARIIAHQAIAAGHDQRLPPVQRMFVYLPFEHSEDVADQQRVVALFESLPVTPEFPLEARDEIIDYGRRHLAIIERFGRFPHRNAALGRATTPEERAFLEQPGSSF
jgi:uncharacterized protein (DUF924 family)